ncbi:hypothetical protein AMECASPLE_031843, partial [Ameca splendens]
GSWKLTAALLLSDPELLNKPFNLSLCLAEFGFSVSGCDNQLEMCAIHCSEWERCVGSSSFTHKLRAASVTLSLHFKEGRDLLLQMQISSAQIPQ